MTKKINSMVTPKQPRNTLPRDRWCTKSQCARPKAGIFFVSPSGGGKNTIIDDVLKLPVKRLIPACTGNLEKMINGTNRPMRPGDMDGVTYYFYPTKEELLRDKRAGQFIEANENYPGHYYGTLWRELHRIASKGDIPVTNVDVKGARRIKKVFGNRALIIFIDPCLSEEELKARIMERSEVPNLQDRIARIPYEMRQKNKFDAVLENKPGELKQACDEAKSIILKFLKKRFRSIKKARV